MDTIKSIVSWILKKKESLLYPVLIITGINLIGWISGRMWLTSFSVKFIPMPHSSAVVFIALSIILYLFIGFENSRQIRSIASILAIFASFYCSLIFFDFLFDFRWDPEIIFIRHPEKFGNVLTGRMSPITSILFVLICLGIPGINKKNPEIVRYIAGSLSLLAAIISSVLLIGYLYNAPLLYGSQFIPVSLPSAICFLLFSITLLRVFDLKFWTFNLIKDNKVTRQLLKSFLPIVILIVILEGFLDTVFSFNDINPPLTAALILLMVVFVTVFIVLRVSANIGAQLLRAEEALKESEQKLLQLNSDKDRFISILGHDLISPFNTLVGYSNLLLEDLRKLETDEIESQLIHINLAAKNTYELLEDLLIWARTQSGKIPFNPQIVSFNEVCTDTLKALYPVADLKKIRINYSSTDHITVFADIDMLKTILRNLVSNAIKFTDYQGAINIYAEEIPGEMAISVSDNGVGIEHDRISRLFDISNVISTAGTADEKGTGLGLLLCREFVEKHKGKIWVESEKGKGSNFKFTLPRSVG